LPRTVAALAASLLPTYICRNTIALSDGLAITESKILRTIQVGEKLEGLGEPEIDKTAPNCTLQRVKVRAGAVGSHPVTTGYVTLKGTQGTVFVELEPKS
jgi:hypothetical protein